MAFVLLIAGIPSVAMRAGASEGKTRLLAIDTARSTAQFSVSHIWVQNVTGTIPIESGTVVLPRGSLIPIGVTATLDPGGVKTDSGDRDAALRSSDFFDAQRFPTWTFTSTKILARGQSAFEIDGNLTLHGVTQPERLEVTVGGDSEDPVYHATAEIDRHAFGMAITRLDPVIGSTVDVTLTVWLSNASSPK
jgi:polyisoprenoid-binding protein YceI